MKGVIKRGSTVQTRVAAVNHARSAVGSLKAYPIKATWTPYLRKLCLEEWSRDLVSPFSIYPLHSFRVSIVNPPYAFFIKTDLDIVGKMMHTMTNEKMHERFFKLSIKKASELSPYTDNVNLSGHMGITVITKLSRFLRSVWLQLDLIRYHVNVQSKPNLFFSTLNSSVGQSRLFEKQTKISIFGCELSLTKHMDASDFDTKNR